MQLTSPAVTTTPGTSTSVATLPVRFAMHAVTGGQNVSIPYVWRDAPSGTKSFALTLVDTAPVAHNWVHWAVVDISASATGLPEGASGTDAMPVGSAELENSYGLKGYGGPQPPAGTGAHPYVATLYALDVDRIDPPPAASAAQLESLLARHALARATFTAYFGR